MSRSNDPGGDLDGSGRPPAADRTDRRDEPEDRGVSGSTTPAGTTLAIDIGGTGLKAMVLDSAATPLTDRVRVPTSYPMTPRRLVAALVDLTAPLPSADRAAVGFPGVVRRGVIRSAPQFDTPDGPSERSDPGLSAKWHGFDLASALAVALSIPTRVANDADVQGLGAITGSGLELVLTLGTGLGSSLFRNGRLAAHLELAHHPAAKDPSYNQAVGDATRRRVGKKRWRRRVERSLADLDAMIRPDSIVLGGGNAKRVDLDHLARRFPDTAAKLRVVGNEAGLRGGLGVWFGQASVDFA
ncbi:MAG: ROK family protein [Microthrixaceae bacterium]